MKDFKNVKIEVYSPIDSVMKIKKAAHSIGAGSSPLYDCTASEITCKGYWRSLEGSNPHIGQIGTLSSEHEIKIELQCKREIVSSVMQAIKKVHPYEIPVINVIPLANHLFE